MKNPRELTLIEIELMIKLDGDYSKLAQLNDLLNFVEEYQRKLNDYIVMKDQNKISTPKEQKPKILFVFPSQ